MCDLFSHEYDIFLVKMVVDTSQNKAADADRVGKRDDDLQPGLWVHDVLPFSERCVRSPPKPLIIPPCRNPVPIACQPAEVCQEVSFLVGLVLERWPSCSHLYECLQYYLGTCLQKSLICLVQHSCFKTPACAKHFKSQLPPARNQAQEQPESV